MSSEVETSVDNPVQRFLHSARNDKRGSCELFQKPQIILHEEADVGNIEQNHREAIHPETECVAAPFLRIVSLVAARFVDRFKDRRMYYARAGDFDPLFAF